MASLPPGWTADYDGQRWFFTYGPTGQSQFQFPRPGDEFPDLVPYCCAFGFGAAGDGDAVPPAGVEGPLLPGERQPRRVSDAESWCCTGDGGAEERALREAGGRDGVGAVCFGNFAAVNSRGGRGLGGGCEAGTATVRRQSRRCGGDDGLGITSTTGVADASGEWTGEPVAAPLVTECEHPQPDSSSHREVVSTATILIMSEPVLVAIAQTTTAAPSLNQQDTLKLTTVAEISPPHELPTPTGRVMELAHTPPPWVLPIGDIPELYSESTALCEEEINPPPVELPCNVGGRRDGEPKLPNAAFQDIFELPAYEETDISLGNGNSAALSDPDCRTGVYAASSRNGQGGVPGVEVRGQDRAGLPSQASRTSSKQPSDKTSLRERVNPGLGQMPSARDDDKPITEKTGTERRDLTHFPSILRPGPRRSDQQQLPRPILTTPVTNTSHAAHARLIQQQKPWEQQQQHKEQVEARPPSHEQPARMPTMPAPHHPDEPQQTARWATIVPEAPPPQPCGARQDRLSGSVNFVIPIRHILGAEPHSPASHSSAAAVEDPPQYQVRASFASSAVSPKGGGPPPAVVVGEQASSRDRSGFVPGAAKKTGSSGGRMDDNEAGPARIVVGGGSTTGAVPKWSWGWAR